MKSGSTPKEHWLLHYLTTHDCSMDEKCLELQALKRNRKLCQKKKFIDDVRSLLRVLVMFLPVPMFWALYDQQGSVWLIQGKQFWSRPFPEHNEFSYSNGLPSLRHASPPPRSDANSQRRPYSRFHPTFPSHHLPSCCQMCYTHVMQFSLKYFQRLFVSDRWERWWLEVSLLLSLSWSPDLFNSKSMWA